MQLCLRGILCSATRKEKRGKGKAKLPHANIYTVISFNCTLLFNLPWTNAFKSRTGGILLKSCLALDRALLIAAALQPGYFPPDNPCYSSHWPRQTCHTAFCLTKSNVRRADCESCVQVDPSKASDKLTFLVLGEWQRGGEVRASWKCRWPNRYSDVGKEKNVKQILI